MTIEMLKLIITILSVLSVFLLLALAFLIVYVRYLEKQIIDADYELVPPEIVRCDDDI